MAIGQVEDRAGGPAIAGTRITVDEVLVYLLNPAMTEASIGRLYDLTAEQVAAARAYILANPDTTLARHLQIEEAMVPANPTEVMEKIRRTRESFLRFKEWLASREAAEATENANGESGRIPSFLEWLAERESRPAGGP